MVDSQQDARRQAAAARRYLWGLAVALATACVVALSEIDAQSGRIVDSAGRAWPFSVLVGPGRAERRAGWLEVISTGLIDDSLYRALLTWHLVIDLVFVITYGCLLAGIVLVLFRSTLAKIAVGVLVGGTVLADLAENVSMAGVMITSAPVWVTLVLNATTVKWFLLVASVVALIVRFVVPQPKTPEPTSAAQLGTDRSPDRAPDQVPPAAEPPPVDSAPAVVRRGLQALMHHRFSVAMIIPLVVLTMLSGSAILEQLPDVQRRWAADGARGVAQGLCAIAALLAVAALLEILARFRTGWAERHRTERPITEDRPRRLATDPTRHWVWSLIDRLLADLRLIGRMVIEVITDRPMLGRRLQHLRDQGDALLALWLLGIAIPVAAALVAAVLMQPPVLITRLLVFCAVPATVVIISWILRRAWQIRPEWYVPYRPPTFSGPQVETIRFTGHALALTALTVGGIGLVRSYVSVVALGPQLTGVGQGAAIAFLALGVAAVLLPWLLSWALAAGREQLAVRDPLASLGTQAPVRLTGRWVLLAGVLVAFVGIAVLPGLVSQLGVSAVAIISLTTLIGIAAAAGLLIQERPTAEVFRIIGLHRTPLVSVLVLAVALAGLTAGTNDIHPVASTAVTAPVSRPPVRTLVQSWLDQPAACEVEVGGQRVRPMIMIAAEGGGIRAAYWTVKGLAALDAGTGGCGAHSTLFSGGASGGSVGLTVARFSGTPTDPGTARAVGAVEAMAQPRTLSQAVIGTFVRDPAFAATGVPLGTDGVAPAGTWADRARLIELGWNDTAARDPWGTAPFLTGSSQLSPATGPLVLNSSSVGSQCRAWVSQLDLEQPTPSAGEQQCDRRVSPGARTVDLFAAYGPSGGAGKQCLGSLTASTAALLTARFPYVTPGGVVGSCQLTSDPASFWPRTQLIDGGYIENTGLATITDLSAQWLAQVRTHNDDVVAGRSTAPLIMPFVVFLTNEQATAGRLTQPPALQSELLLPAVGYLRGSATLTRTDALLQRVSTTVRTRSICPPRGSGAIDCDAVADRFPRRVIVVDRTAQPEVTAPLGWVISEASMTGLDRAMQHQVQTTCSATSTEPSCLRGYGTLGDLLGYLRGT